ncbi:MAG: hypothetical protein KatS3mg035_0375 [Bacteroidia bacterium]|nr:MAG: hypothetical protein KatS3mg035_0375 [Bacteroidia bacterium]
MEPLDKQSIKNVLEEVEKEAEKLAKKIKTSQIRNFYSKIIKIKQDFEKKCKQME